ncbi:MAG: hypothetical protein ACPGPF_05920 [Pontibacterium sp.]
MFAFRVKLFFPLLLLIAGVYGFVQFSWIPEWERATVKNQLALEQRSLSLLAHSIAQQETFNLEQITDSLRNTELGARSGWSGLTFSLIEDDDALNTSPPPRTIKARRARACVQLNGCCSGSSKCLRSGVCKS